MFLCFPSKDTNQYILIHLKEHSLIEGPPGPGGVPLPSGRPPFLTGHMVRRDMLEHAEIEEINDIYLEENETVEGSQDKEGMLKVEQHFSLI